MPRPDERLHPRPLPPVGRNDPCPCGSGAKHKRCCLAAEPSVETSAEDEAQVVDRPDPGHELFVVELGGGCGGLQHVGGREPAGEQVVRHQISVFGVALGIVGVRRREQATHLGAVGALGQQGPQLTAQVAQDGPFVVGELDAMAAGLDRFDATGGFSHHGEPASNRSHSSWARVAQRPCSWRR